MDHNAQRLERGRRNDAANCASVDNRPIAENQLCGLLYSASAREECNGSKPLRIGVTRAKGNRASMR
jgi:hypothetical protein